MEWVLQVGDVKGVAIVNYLILFLKRKLEEKYLMKKNCWKNKSKSK